MGKPGLLPRAALLVAMAAWLAACGGKGESGGPSTQPTSVVIAVSDSRRAPTLGEAEPLGVFVVVRYVLANGADEDIVVSQGDFTLNAPEGAAIGRSETGTDAWGRSPGGYELTETVLLKPGRMPRSWVSVFDVPESDDSGPWTLRYKNEPPVDVPAPSQ